MNLSDFFDDNTRREYVKSNIQVGIVLKVFIKTTKPAKEKRCIIIGTDENGHLIGVVLFNTELNLNVHASFELASLQYLIKKEDENVFIDWDSYVDCSTIIELNYEEIVTALLQDTSKILGKLSQEHLNKIIEYIKISPKIAPKKIKQYKL
jgi:hypothetical protein